MSDRGGSSSGPQVVGAPDLSLRQNGSTRLRSPPRADLGRGETPFEELQAEEESDPIVQAFAALPVTMGWTIVVFIASTLDILSSCVVIVLGLRYGFKDEAASLVSIALQVVSHMMSSLLLAVRMLGNLLPPPEPQGENVANAVSKESLVCERQRRDITRERDVGRAIGFIMAGGSLGVIALAIWKVAHWNSWHEEQDREVARMSAFLAWFCVAVYALQVLLRRCAAKSLETVFIRHCSIISFISLLGVGTLAAAAALEEGWSWKVEPIFAFVLALLMCGEAYLIIRGEWVRESANEFRAKFSSANI